MVPFRHNVSPAIRAALLLAVGVLCLPQWAHAQAPAQKENRLDPARFGFSLEGESSYRQYVKDNHVFQELIHTRFHMVDVDKALIPGSTARYYSPVLIRERVENVYLLGAEGRRSKITLTAWHAKGGELGQYTQKLWEFGDEADEGEMDTWGKIYVSSKYGCCGQENLMRSYDLLSGRLMFAHSVPVLDFRVRADTNARSVLDRKISYIGVRAPMHGDKKEGCHTGNLSHERKHIGAVALASFPRGRFGKVLDCVFIKVADFEPFSSPVVSMRGLTMGADWRTGPEGDLTLRLKGTPEPASAGDFAVMLDYGGGWTVTLPVENDRFAIKKAVLGKGQLSVER